MAKAVTTPALNDGTLAEEGEIPNISGKPRIRPAAGSGSEGKPACKASRKAVVEDSGGEDANTNANANACRAPSSETKASIVLKKLHSAKGATIEAMMQATGWQAHSVRGFLSAVVRKKLGHSLVSETGKDRIRRYRIQADGKAG